MARAMKLLLAGPGVCALSLMQAAHLSLTTTLELGETQARTFCFDGNMNVLFGYPIFAMVELLFHVELTIRSSPMDCFGFSLRNPAPIFAKFYAEPMPTKYYWSVRHLSKTTFKTKELTLSRRLSLMRQWFSTSHTLNSFLHSSRTKNTNETYRITTGAIQKGFIRQVAVIQRSLKS